MRIGERREREGAYTAAILRYIAALDMVPDAALSGTCTLVHKVLGRK
jgi:hypothetical protein